MNHGEAVTISSVVVALLNETQAQLKDDVFHFRLGLQDFSLSCKYKTDYFNGQILQVDAQFVHINNRLIKRVEDLTILGFTPLQLDILRNNASNAEVLMGLKLNSHKHPQQVITNVLGRHDFNHENLWVYLSGLSQADCFVLCDCAFNVNGSVNNPLKYTMVGDESALSYHPVSCATALGWVEVPFVRVEPERLQVWGTLSKLQGAAAQLVKSGLIPIHPYNLKYLQAKLPDLKVENYLRMRILSSKRSMIPFHSSEQVKMSIRFQITSRNRLIHAAEAQNAVANTRLVQDLIETGCWPQDVWIFADQYASMIEGEPASTVIMRSGLDNLLALGRRSLPKDCQPVMACCLWNENLIQDKSLLLSMAEAGVDIDDFMQRAVVLLIHKQLELINYGYIPESHSQNLIYLIDKRTGMPKGLLLRDSEGAKVDLQSISRLGLVYDGVYSEQDFATSPIAIGLSDRAKIITRYLHYAIFDSNLLLLLNHGLQFSCFTAEYYCQFIKQVYIDWWLSNNKNYKDYESIIAPGYHQHNLLARGLKIKALSKSRILNHCPFLPSHNEMAKLLDNRFLL